METREPVLVQDHISLEVCKEDLHASLRPHVIKNLANDALFRTVFIDMWVCRIFAAQQRTVAINLRLVARITSLPMVMSLLEKDVQDDAYVKGLRITKVPSWKIALINSTPVQLMLTKDCLANYWAIVKTFGTQSSWIAKIIHCPRVNGHFLETTIWEIHGCLNKANVIP